MPDENINDTEVLGALDNLEEYCLDNKLARVQNYNVIQSALDKDGYFVDANVLERILAVCVHDLKEDMKYTAVIMNVIPMILHRVKGGTYNPQPDLVPSALAIMNIIKTTALLRKVETLKVLCYDTLLSYPDTTLITAVKQEPLEVLEIFNLYCHTLIPIEVRMQACSFLYKLLKILPPEEKRTFIEKGMLVWFSKIIPTAMAHISKAGADREMSIEILELLTYDVIHFDYSGEASWKQLLEGVCRPDKYPLLMKTLLQEGSDVWHRLWMVFIKLLKHQITQSFGTIGTPINSMLPVVEAAFKVDVSNRCKAFECWNVLIDSFATETNESNIIKRLKLLVIPLKSNNAKAEETALAKFKCWWHLIIKFQTKMDRFLDTILVSFLNFVFGRHNAIDKTAVVPGQITVNVKRQTVKAIVELVGHVDCEGCTDLPKLKGKIITTKHLVDNWTHWVYSLTSAIMMAAQNDNMLTKQQIKCLWKSYILTIGELPDNFIRKDLFYEILSIAKHLIQESKYNRKLADIAFNVLLMSLFDGDPVINTLLKTKNGDNNPMNETLNILQEPSLKDFYQSYDIKELVTKLRHITNLIVDKHFNPTYVVARFLAELPGTDVALTLWTAVAESICDNERMCAKNLLTMLLWPLKFMDAFSDLKLAAITWYRLYNLVQPKINKTDVDKEIMKILFAPKEFTSPISYFTLSALLAVMKYKLSDEQFTGWNREAELLENLINNIESYTSIEDLFPVIIDGLELILNNVIVNINEKLARHALICVKNVLRIATQDFKDQLDDNHVVSSTLGNILRTVSKLLSIEAYSKLVNVVADDLIQYTYTLEKHNSLKSSLLNLLKTMINDNVKNHDDTGFNKISDAINNFENVTTNNVELIETNKTEKDKVNVSDNNKFTTPTSNELPKKSKKKEPSIVNTVLDNGEEYVVVKSNWKFNPRKLTENQKEKFKRKREDIPALYQDLSQSQDEFQLATWKTDSQDTSSSKSESKSNAEATEDATIILKNLPSSDVVPNIMDNLTKEKNADTDMANGFLPKNVPNKTEPVTPKNTKSPRMALKDRVFRNVRNLIEKSSVQKENKEIDDQNKPETFLKTSTPAKMDLENNKSETNIKTPTANKIKITESILNSAPPLISAERPSRVKRKPKKFDDLELLALKKRRNSLQSTQSDAKMVKTTVEIHAINKSNDEKLNKATDKDDTANVKENAPIEPVVDINDTEVLENEAIEKDVNKKDDEESVIKVDNNNLEEQRVDELKDDIVIAKPDDTPNTDKKDANKINEKLEDTPIKEVPETSTPKQAKVKEPDEQKSTAKKNSVKKSRIEKELAIDMVEGHPFLKMQSEKRLTRKHAATPPVSSGRRKGLAEKLNKSKSDSSNLAKSDKKNKEKKGNEDSEASFVVDETQENAEVSKDSTPEELHSEDVIESSQESTFSTMSVKSAKKTPKKIPLVSIEKLKPIIINKESINTSQSILDSVAPVVPDSPKCNQDSKDDIELPLNKTAMNVKSFSDLTENIDTEPINDNDISEDVIIINDDMPPVIVSSDDTIVGKETQKMADADTQPIDPNDFTDNEMTHDKPEIIVIPDVDEKDTCNMEVTVAEEIVDNDENKTGTTQNDITATLSESACGQMENTTEVSSPFKDDAQRKQDFLNNTIEISPIKTMSPDPDNMSPSPETSSDYVVIKLTSPVHSNGEPFEKVSSPEFFTDDKVSPDKRDQSPPRVEVSVTNTSPSSSLSLKKNRPQVRPGGRAAQMLGLCVPETLNAIINAERSEQEEAKKCSPSNTPARRNLRILYNTVHNESNDNPSENDDPESFLKFKRSLPAVDSSPSGPILKRKLAEITDDATISPASKRKRVSFHDPPVSTTISVQKYIEPGGARSPQNSAQKRLVRMMRQHTPMKSPKRLDNAFKLDSALTKTLESFSDAEMNNTAGDTQQSSLEETPTVEIVKASELNDTDPICLNLLECKDPIDNIAAELSSPAMKSLLIKELEGKVETVGDLAKMTELEVNRLCIKAPKVKIARKVLNEYASKKGTEVPNVTVTLDAAMFDETMNEAVSKADVEVQTIFNVVNHMEVQTTPVPVTCSYIQTDEVVTSHSGVQTEESGEGSTADIIKSCLLKRPDFIEELGEQLEESSIHKINDKLPFGSITDLLMKKVTSSNLDAVLNRLLEQQNADSPAEERKSIELSYLQDYICNRFDSKDLILFCSQLLQKVHDKPA